jgi:hypothetical protein
MASKILVDEISPQTGTDIVITATKKISGANTQYKVTGGASGQVLKNDGSDGLSWAADSAGLFSSYAVIADQKTAGTQGGTSTAGSWQTRDINYTVFDPDSIVTIAANIFTLAAGNYFIKWMTTAYKGHSQQNRLSINGGAVVGVGGIGRTANADEPNINMIGMARVTPVTSTGYVVEQKTDTTATNGFGSCANLGEPEMYAWIEIYKET